MGLVRSQNWACIMGWLHPVVSHRLHGSTIIPFAQLLLEPLRLSPPVAIRTFNGRSPIFAL
jgi:hypothetical protein